MKKIVGVVSALLSLILPKAAFAQINTPTLTPVATIIISPPAQGYSDIGFFVTNLLTLAFAIAIFIVLIMLIWGAFEWITSGGDKEAVAKARNRIINALIGLAVLAVAYALGRLAGQFLGFDITKGINIPGPR